MVPAMVQTTAQKSADSGQREALRRELLRLILKNEAQRRASAPGNR
jgi:hypothetical protein